MTKKIYSCVLPYVIYEFFMDEKNRISVFRRPKQNEFDLTLIASLVPTDLDIKANHFYCKELIKKILTNDYKKIDRSFNM